RPAPTPVSPCRFGPRRVRSATRALARNRGSTPPPRSPRLSVLYVSTSSPPRRVPDTQHAGYSLHLLTSRRELPAFTCAPHSVPLLAKRPGLALDVGK